MEKDNKKSGFLMERLAADATSAGLAALGVAPFVSMIDKAIIENASGRHDLFTSIKLSFKTLVTRPHIFITKPSFYLVLMVYSGTLFTSNVVDTLTSYKGGDTGDISLQTGSMSKFAMTSSVNIGLGLYKDSQFTRLFGTVTKPRAVPHSTYGLFIARDVLTIFFSFIVPPLVSPLIPQSTNFGGLSKETVTQMLSPAICQVFSTPFHLLGLDMYNRMNEGKIQYTWKQRWEVVRKNWSISALARMGKIVPAFGIGGVANKQLRDGLMEKVEKLRELELKNRKVVHMV
ncbi:hypothetical protein BJ508DRAFT_415142 [Ascobolus immersus RN42]|uniref:Sequence orphan n=1 Tax=Ascobolus immersus RN42 TaxID=1160509 RepID=A0A3N4I445_ASCIM|nr:hypothetical protein BJ508DRAFT_415142 [Ascobolus immersus RN42]